MKGLIAALLFILGCGFSLVSQADDDQGWLEDFLQKLGADGEFDPDKLIDFSVLPGPFYNPEMDLGVGVSAVGLYQVNAEDEDLQLSSLVINGLASTNGALGASLQNRTFFNQRQRFYLDAQLFDVPDVYYGVGYNQNHVDANRVDFNALTFALKPMWVQQLFANSFIGVGFDLQLARASDINPNDSDVDTSLLAQDSRSVGVNLLINYDTRDNTLNPQRGRIIELESSWYRQQLGSKTDFEKQAFLYSEYLPVWGSDVIAWQVRGRFLQGDIPWDQLSKIGGGDSLRGYTTGRYRDKQMLLTQAEYRLDLPGRHGMVFWAGAGVIADKASELFDQSVLPNYGVGYRFEVKPRVNLRLDMGFGDGDSGFYFNVNEAF
ncbi:BamA/TamA family outer membrane protein [Shewanella waksmanii]|uniref:BamA/TamA family outer membrane protein n=1 Tax=Shewanella waksmanii TaxID=213783 RepID=UPI00373567DA